MKKVSDELVDAISEKLQLQRYLVSGVLRLAEERAVERAIRAFCGAHRDIQARYVTDVRFHRAVDVLAQVMVAGAFDKNLISDEEAEIRMKNFQVVLDSLS